MAVRCSLSNNIIIVLFAIIIIFFIIITNILFHFLYIFFIFSTLFGSAGVVCKKNVLTFGNFTLFLCIFHYSFLPLFKNDYEIPLFITFFLQCTSLDDSGNFSFIRIKYSGIERKRRRRRRKTSISNQ